VVSFGATVALSLVFSIGLIRRNPFLVGKAVAARKDAREARRPKLGPSERESPPLPREPPADGSRRAVATRPRPRPSGVVGIACLVGAPNDVATFGARRSYGIGRVDDQCPRRGRRAPSACEDRALRVSDVKYVLERRREPPDAGRAAIAETSSRIREEQGGQPPPPPLSTARKRSARRDARGFRG